MTKAATLAALTLTLLFTPPSMAASDEPIKFGEDRFKLSAGGFFPGFSSEMTIDIMADGENKTIDVEDDLGLKSSTNTFRVDGYWRVGPRHRITVGYYALNRSGTRVLETDIEWEDVVYPVGVNIDSQVDFDVVPISYAYSFLKRENWEIAASIGVHWMKIDTNIEGQAFVDGDGDDVLTVEREGSDVSGPFPLLGLMVDFQPAPKWQIGATIQYLDLSIGKYRGRLFDARAYVEYYVWRNVGVGLSYNFFDLDAGVKKEDFHGRFNIEYDGVIAYLTTKF
jgi:hypothetical protein